MFTHSLNRGKKYLEITKVYCPSKDGRHTDYLCIKTDVQVICVLKFDGGWATREKSI